MKHTAFMLATSVSIQRPIVGLVALLVTPADGARQFGVLLNSADAVALGKALMGGAK